MGDDIRNPGTELNEAALEGISGGDILPKDPDSRAFVICHNCTHHLYRTCSRQREELADYMRAHGLIKNEAACPFYN